jgi:biopolymer transport protein ExbB
MWSELARSFQNGDVYIYIMLAVAFLGTVIIFERFIMLQFVFNVDFTKFLTNLKKMIRAEDMDRAIALCKSSSHTSLPRITLKALEAAETDPTTIRGTIEEEAIEFLPRIESRLSVLPALATLVLLIGILGTIDQLWSAFHSIDVLDTAQKQSSIGHSIAGSLNYTTMGLLVCMLLLIGHQMLKGFALKLTERIYHGTTVLTNLLAPQQVEYMPAGAGAAIAPMVGGGIDAPAPMAEVEQITTAEVATQTAAKEEIDDASVEDIKDEEEII